MTRSTMKITKQRVCPKARLNNRGVTVVELITAVSLGSLLVAMVMFSWTTINRHTVTSHRRAQLHTDTYRIVRSLATDLRRAQTIVGWFSHGVSFVPAGTEDTVIVMFESGELRRNGIATKLFGATSRVSDFEISAIEEGLGPEGPMVLLELFAESIDEFDNQARVESLVAVNKPDKDIGAIGGWNY